MISERIENTGALDNRKNLLYCSIGLIICFFVRFYFANSQQLLELVWWLDSLLYLLPALYLLVTQNRMKRKAQQFVEWSDDKIIFKLKKNIVPVEIIKSEIKSFNVKNGIISVFKINGEKIDLDISDFDFETKNRIEEKFYRS